MTKGSFNELQVRIHSVLDKLSNSEVVDIDDADIEEAGEAFKAAMRKQFKPREEGFRLRMSNIGRPLCQLQKEQVNAPKSRNDYNHVMRMLIGDAVEAAMVVIIKASGANITGAKNKVSLDVNNSVVNGEDDIEIDGATWDIKSSAPWAFANKWAHGWDGVYSGDTFGYVAQLYGYSEAKGKPMGGWIVVDKSSGEVLVVHAEPTPEQLIQIKENIEFTEHTITSNAPFRRQFEDEAETFYKKPTGNRVLPITCSFCSYLGDCWPTAVKRTNPLSKAQNPKPTWYTKYEVDGGDK